MSNLNEITKERTIVQGCMTGMHEYTRDNSMVTMIDGRIVMALKCSVCGVETVQSISGLEGTAAVESIKNTESPKQENTLESVPVDSGPKIQERVLYEEPMEQSRRDAPPWAAQVTERYIKDQNIDGFWKDIKEMAKR